MPTLAFDVISGRKVIDTVFHTFTTKATRAELEADVRRSLIQHDGYPADIKVRLMSRITRIDHDLEGYYGQGWEVLTSADTRRQIWKHMKEYRENEGGIYRIVTRRVSLFNV